MGAGPEAVELVAAALGKANDIKPVPRPALAEAIASQQSINEAVHRIGSSVLHEGVDLLRRRRQAGKVIREPANEFLAVDRWAQRQPLLLQLCQEEGVNRVADHRLWIAD